MNTIFLGAHNFKVAIGSQWLHDAVASGVQPVFQYSREAAKVLLEINNLDKVEDKPYVKKDTVTVIADWLHIPETIIQNLPKNIFDAVISDLCGKKEVDTDDFLRGRRSGGFTEDKLPADQLRQLQDEDLKIGGKNWLMYNALILAIKRRNT